MTVDDLWTKLHWVMESDPTSDERRTRYIEFRAQLDALHRESKLVEWMYIDAYASYMLPPLSCDERKTSRSEALLCAVLALDPAHSGASMTLGYLRYDQGLAGDALRLFSQANPADLEGEHPARRLEMIAACHIELGNLELAAKSLDALREEWARLGPFEYEPLSLSLLVARLSDSGRAGWLEPLRSRLLEFDRMGGFSWFAEEFTRGKGPGPRE
jgi:hypothetical protein